MSSEATNRTPLFWWIVAICVVLGISTTTFLVHRYRVDSAIKEAAPLIANRDSVRIASNEKELGSEKAAARRDTLENLLKVIELELKKRPADSMLVISAANTAYDLEKFDIAERYYRQFLDNIDKTNNAVKIDLAYVMFRNGKAEESISTIRNVIRKEPNNQIAMFNLAYIYEQTGKPELAKTWIKKCVEVNPNSELGKQASRILNDR